MPDPVVKRFTAAGRGELPADMLRNDQCGPATATAADAIAAHHGPPGPEAVLRREVTLETTAKSAASRQRWTSPGWRVVD